MFGGVFFFLLEAKILASIETLNKRFTMKLQHTARVPNRRPRTWLRLEQLESRLAPATLSSPTMLTYQDADGDNVTVTLSRPILNVGNVNAVFTFAAGSVNGSNATMQQLQKIDLTAIGAGLRHDDYRHGRPEHNQRRRRLCGGRSDRRDRHRSGCRDHWR